jgi:hypothetical protein
VFSLGLDLDLAPAFRVADFWGKFSSVSNPHRAPSQTRGLAKEPSTPNRTVVENHTSAADKKAGIGLIFESTRPGNTGLAVSSIPPGGPAYACGKIEVGDFLVAVNDHNVEEFDPQRIAPYILGPRVGPRVFILSFFWACMLQDGLPAHTCASSLLVWAPQHSTLQQPASSSSPSLCPLLPTLSPASWGGNSPWNRKPTQHLCPFPCRGQRSSWPFGRETAGIRL